MKKILSLGLAAVASTFIMTGCTDAAKDEPKKVEEAAAKKEEAKPEKTEFKIGETIEQNGYTLLVKKVEKKAKLSEFMKPDEGKEYVVVDVELSNVGKETIPFNSMYFQMQDGDNVILNTDASGFGLSDSLKSGDLATEGKVAGKIVFQAKKGDNNLTVIYKPLNFSGTELKIKLQ
ncbi:DUF4352 domain-containing protein [Priestia taiwanensis]|uniref:Long-chain-fatty-acid--CoA ligase n=1 Tax=Priestia taiwanensis TaxID=1347902 RepID=A0A917ARN6_9BACI|nr:DUF4352 domain-containing protein [Priestia taiwanensis]MBM7363927.1 hypothetical protein [Priestia taiwanensis]GGE70203.1 long-chain-fatty-acid--CoA ligase [Priestia taiwanensis]